MTIPTTPPADAGVIDRALAAYNAVWQASSPLTAQTVDAVRREAMAAALLAAPAADAVADMRERCAKACEAEADRIEAKYWEDGVLTKVRIACEMKARYLAEAIRALPLTLTGEADCG